MTKRDAYLCQGELFLSNLSDAAHCASEVMSFHLVYRLLEEHLPHRNEMLGKILLLLCVNHESALDERVTGSGWNPHHRVP
jgi:hypothetical protein